MTEANKGQELNPATRAVYSIINNVKSKDVDPRLFITDASTLLGLAGARSESFRPFLEEELSKVPQETIHQAYKEYLAALDTKDQTGENQAAIIPSLLNLGAFLGLEDEDPDQTLFATLRERYQQFDPQALKRSVAALLSQDPISNPSLFLFPPGVLGNPQAALFVAKEVAQVPNPTITDLERMVRYLFNIDQALVSSCLENPQPEKTKLSRPENQAFIDVRQKIIDFLQTTVPRFLDAREMEAFVHLYLHICPPIIPFLERLRRKVQYHRAADDLILDEMPPQEKVFFIRSQLHRITKK